MCGPSSGAYQICRFFLKDDQSEVPDYSSVKWGYDTAQQALRALPKIAEESGIKLEELCVVRAYFSEEDIDE